MSKEVSEMHKLVRAMGHGMMEKDGVPGAARSRPLPEARKYWSGGWLKTLEFPVSTLYRCRAAHLILATSQNDPEVKRLLVRVLQDLKVPQGLDGYMIDKLNEWRESSGYNGEGVYSWQLMTMT